MNGFSVHGRLPLPSSDPNSGLNWEEGVGGFPHQLPWVDFRQSRGYQWERLPNCRGSFLCHVLRKEIVFDLSADVGKTVFKRRLSLGDLT